jgi:uncharacterized surface protein with fasciclin (FAS1) repeats
LARGSWHTPDMVAFKSGRRVTVVALVIVALVAALVFVYIVRRGSDSEPADTASDGLHGPLCDALPAGEDPGGPEQLARLDAAVALTWIPVLTIFEASTRAAGLTTELADSDGLTIFAPSDDALLLTLGQETLDDLIIFRNAELRRLLESHLVDESLTLRDLAAVGEVTTRAADTVAVVAAGDEVRLGEQAHVVCGNYRVANGTIHVIDAVLGELPAPAEPGQPVSG